MNIDKDAIAEVIELELSQLPFAPWTATSFAIGEFRGSQVQLVFTKDEDEKIDISEDRRFVK